MPAPRYARKDLPVQPGICGYTEQNDFSFPETCETQRKNNSFALFRGAASKNIIRMHPAAAAHGPDLFLLLFPWRIELENYSLQLKIGQSPKELFCSSLPMRKASKTFGAATHPHGHRAKELFSVSFFSGAVQKNYSLVLFPTSPWCGIFLRLGDTTHASKISSGRGDSESGHFGKAPDCPALISMRRKVALYGWQ